VAGNENLNKTINTYFSTVGRRATLVTTVSLGMTNLSPSSAEASTIKWNGTSFDGTAPSESKVEQFFMPEWLEIRKRQLPISEIFDRQNRAWKELMKDGSKWVNLERVYGASNVKNTYEILVKDGLGPDRGLVWSLWDEDKVSPDTIQTRL